MRHLTHLFLKYLVTSSKTLLNEQFLTSNHQSKSDFVFYPYRNDIDGNANVGTNHYWASNYTNVKTLAMMSHNAYLNINDTRWIDTETNKTTDIRYSDETVHAYLFSDIVSSVNVISFKGTSLGIVGAISYNDRFNDNLFYSCCYYKESSMFDKKVCNPNTDDKNKCYRECYSNSTQYENNYYTLAKAIMKGVFDNLGGDRNTITILTGHSLGGTLATLMGLEYNLPVVTFNSPGEKHYVDLMGMKYNSGNLENIFHYGHDADIIFTGKCHGTLSWCGIAGYIVETKCHLGKTCVYNATGELGIGESILTHPINYVLKNIIPHWEKGMPVCEVSECEECGDWNYT
jgi:lipase ATG15